MDIFIISLRAVLVTFGLIYGFAVGFYNELLQGVLSSEKDKVVAGTVYMLIGIGLCVLGYFLPSLIGIFL